MSKIIAAVAGNSAAAADADCQRRPTRKSCAGDDDDAEKEDAGARKQGGMRWKLIMIIERRGSRAELNDYYALSINHVAVAFVVLLKRLLLLPADGARTRVFLLPPFRPS